MKNIRALLVLLALAAAGQAPALAQTNDPAITPNGVIGEVVAVDTNAKTVFVKTDAGSVVTVSVADSTAFKKLPPGEKTLTNAADMPFAELGAGDRVFARGAVSDDRKSVMARMVVVMTRSDLARKHEADRAEWKRRGVGGVVTALNPSAREITVQPFGGRPAGPPPAEGQAGPPPGPPPPVVIAAAGPAVKFRRYAPDSVKFADAKASTFEELKVGDQVRALGERSADGARLTAEEVVSGSFRTVLGTVKAVNPAAREIQITTAEGSQPMTVVVSKDSELKLVPAEFGQRVMRGPGGGPGGGGPGAHGAAPAGGGQSRPRPAAGDITESAPVRMPLTIQDMLERLPAATVEEVKPGTMIVFSTTGADPSKATAIQLVAGVEPIVQMMQARAAAQNRPLNLGSFNLGIGQP